MSSAEELRQQVEALQKQLNELIKLSPESTSDTHTPHVSSVSVKLSNFWEHKPAIWFAQAEAQFEIAGIKSDSTKYGHILSKLDDRIAGEVEDVIENPPKEGRYEVLKEKLITRFSISNSQKVRNLLSEVPLGDRKPSAFLRHLRSLSGTKLQDESILRELWLRRLPNEVQRILAAQKDLPLDKLADIGDTIVETTTGAPLSSVQAVQSDWITVMRRLDAIEKKIENISNYRSRTRSQSGTSSRTSSATRSGSCWYHKRFADKATKCIKPCQWNQDKGNGPSSQ